MVEIREIHESLLELHGTPSPPRQMTGVDYIINTILSQNTADTNRDAAHQNLLETYEQDYEAIETADTDDLVDTIRIAGLGNQKARRIQDALRTIREYNGNYSTDFIHDLETEEAREWLTNIKGIGPKTAALVLLFHFDKPIFPVDTHCLRLGERFGILDEGTTAEKAHRIYDNYVPDEIKYSFHVLLITHGREYCTARSPDCENPVCQEYCECEYCI